MVDTRFGGRHWVAALFVLFAAAAVEAEPESNALAGTRGPDVTVFNLSDTSNFGVSNGIRGYSIGTTSCNVGDEPLQWCDNAGAAGCAPGTTPADHPVIAQNIYRLKDGRFDQIGASWLKHGFLSVNSSSPGCGTGSCQQPPFGSDQLGVGCTDPYGSGLNGSRPLGRRSEVNPANGEFPFPFGGGGASSEGWNQRVAVEQTKLEPALNGGARYFIEGHYVTPDDAVAGNALNNASYREVTVNQSTFNLNMLGGTVREKAAIEAWQDIDPAVELVNVDLPTVPVQRFHVARKVTEVVPGELWHYEYAVHNMNASRATDALAIRFFGTTVFSGIGFSDVDAHSNEPYDTTDWPSSTTADTIQWAAPPFPAAPEDANAIRWGTMYNFWFDANRPPDEIFLHTLDLFEEGTPAQLSFLEGDDTLLVDGFE